MAKRGSLSFIELHLEKGLLGLAVLALAAAATFFLILEPNKLDFGGQPLGPRELDESIKRKAQELQQAVQKAQPKAPEIPAYSRKLRESFEGGIFAAPDGNAPALPPELKIAARFGQPLPALDGDKETNSVAVVPPLPPGTPAVRTGISLVRLEPLALSTPAKPNPAGEPEPTELSWVSVGAYFSVEAQQKELLAAGYAAYRAKPSLVGVEVQRQEMLPDGGYSAWADVQPGKAMPRFDPPAPVFDRKTGDLQNTKELDEKLKQTTELQTELLQPPFFPVEAGDEWEPPLPGSGSGEDVESGDEPKPEPPADTKKPPKKPPGEERLPGAGGRRNQPPPPPSPSGQQRPGGFNPPSGTPPPGAPQPSAGAKIKETLKEARKALKDKNYDAAEQKARAVIQNADAKAGDKKEANKILDEAKRALDKLKKQREGARPTGREREKRELVKNPENEGEVAVWFHDEAVSPGKTYRYRLRVKLWNRYVGRRTALRDPTQAEKTVLAGEWSAPSAPITVAPKRRFFVRGPVFGESAANIEVYTWHRGHWLKEDFKVRVGDTIGAPATVKTGETDKDGKTKKEQIDFATGAVVLDLRLDEPVQIRREAGKEGEFKYTEAKSLVLVYLDPADGQVRERIAELDKNDPQYKKLKEEWDAIK
jgi:hypothetical protein